MRRLDLISPLFVTFMNRLTHADFFPVVLHTTNGIHLKCNHSEPY